MQKTKQQLTDWLQMKIHFTPSEFDFFENGSSFYIQEDGADEPFAVCTIDSADRLIGLDYLDPDQFGTGKLLPADMPSIAETFIRTFHPAELENYRLQSVIDLDAMYIVEYGIQDDKYHLDLPGIGFSLTITAAGQVVQFNFNEGPADIRYPEHILSKEEAKAAYAGHIDFELEIRKTDTDLFRNGDNTYRLVWSLKEAAVDIPADGSEPDSVAEESEYEALPALTPSSLPLHESLGITQQHVKIGEQPADGLRIEKWQHPLLEATEEIEFSEAYASNMVTIHYDNADFPVFIYNGEEWTGEETELDEETLQQRAFDFVYSLFPNAKEQFKMEKLEEEIDWDEFEEEIDELADDLNELEEEEETEWIDEPGEAEEEPAQEFYFQRFLNGVPVADQTLVVTVGRYSGRIISAAIETEKLPSDLQTSPALTKPEAVDRLMQQLVMELAMSMEFDDDGESFYRLTYLPSFPETTGHVRVIDAVDGTAYFMEVGGSIFY